MDSLRSMKTNGEYQELLDYAQALRLETSDPGELAFIYYCIAAGYQLSDFNIGLSYLDSARQLNPSRALNLDIDLLFASFHRRLANYDLAMETCRYLITAVNETDDPRIEFGANRHLSICFRKLSIHDSAMHYMIRADQIAQESGDKKLSYYAKQGRANLLYELGRYEECLEIEREILRVSKTLNNENFVLTSLINLGASFSMTSQVDSNIYYHELAAEKALELKDLQQAALIMNNIGSLHYHTGKVDLAVKVYKESIENAKKISRNDIAIGSYSRLSYLLWVEGFPESEQYALEGLKMAEEQGNIRIQEEFNQTLFEVNRQKGNNKAAIEYLLKSQLLKDSILNADRMRVLEEMETKYETQKKEQEIATLAQQNEIKDLQLQQQRIIFMFAIAILILAILLGIFIYKQYQGKVKQRQLYLEQNLLRTQMNPHFIFNALASIQGFITRNNRAEAATYLAKFGELTRDILEASRSELIPLSKEVEMIRNYVHLEQARFSKPLDLDIRMEGIEDIEDFMVPPMMIQPFLENAIKHGFKAKESGKIDVEIKRTGKTLNVVINDDGSGIGEDQSTLGASLATKIVRERLQYLKGYARQLFLTISNRKDEKGNILGVKVDLTLPLSHAT